MEGRSRAHSYNSNRTVQGKPLGAGIGEGNSLPSLLGISRVVSNLREKQNVGKKNTYTRESRMTRESFESRALPLLYVMSHVIAVSPTRRAILAGSINVTSELKKVIITDITLTIV